MSGDMGDQSAVFFYRIATMLAGFVATAAVVSYFFNAPRGMPVVSVAALGVAVTIWLVGWACRNIIAGR